MSIAFDEASIKADPAYPKVLELKGNLTGKSCLVSFSGGVDSTLLAFLARWICTRSLAVTASSPTLGRGELQSARKLASLIGIPHRVIQYNELENPEFAKNPRDRCYHCKKGLLDAMGGIIDLRRFGSDWVTAPEVWDIYRRYAEGVRFERLFPAAGEDPCYLYPAEHLSE